jgi:hypothetical protein
MPRKLLLLSGVWHIFLNAKIHLRLLLSPFQCLLIQMDPQIGEKYTWEQILAMGYEGGMGAQFARMPCLRPTDGRPVERYFVKMGSLYKIVEPTPENLLFH